MQEMWVQFLGGEDPLEGEMATHSSILAWKIPSTEQPGGLQSMRWQGSPTCIKSEVAQSCPTLCNPVDCSPSGSAVHEALLSMGLSRQEYWSRLPFPSPGDLPNPGFEPRSPALQADALTSEHGVYVVVIRDS